MATAKTVTATEVATDGTVAEDRWPPMDFPGLSTRAVNIQRNEVRFVWILWETYHNLGVNSEDRKFRGETRHCSKCVKIEEVLFTNNV